MSQNPLTKLTHQLINHFASYPEDSYAARATRYGELIRYQNENLVDCGDLSIAASKINWECFCQKHGLQLRTLTDQLLPDEKSKEDLLEQSKQWIFPLQSVKKVHRERFALRFHRAPIIMNVLNSILTKGESYGKHSNLEDDGTILPPSLCLTLNERFSDLEVGNTKELHKFRAKQLYLIVCRLLAYANWRLVEPQNQTDDTLVVSVECNNLPRRTSIDLPEKKIVRMVCGPVLEPTKKTAATLTSSSYMA